MDAYCRSPGERLKRLYTRWSAGGAGLLITGNVMIDGRHLGEPGNVVLEEGRSLDAFRTWAERDPTAAAVVFALLCASERGGGCAPDRSIRAVP